jgi:hypothetical protein
MGGRELKKFLKETLRDTAIGLLFVLGFVLTLTGPFLILAGFFYPWFLVLILPGFFMVITAMKLMWEL